MDEKINISKPPSFLRADSKKKYYAISEMLVNEGKWKPGDEIALAALCANYQHWIDAEKAIKSTGQLTFETDTGYKQQIPEIGIANNCMKSMLSFIREFGLTPSTRAKLKELIMNNNDDEEMEGMIIK